MNSHSIRRSLVMIVLLAGAGCQKQGGPVPDPKAPPNTLSDDEKATGWTLLFDGKTTAGWRNYGKSTISDGWTVQDGALTRTGAGGDVITTGEFKNFDLSIDWKARPTTSIRHRPGTCIPGANGIRRGSSSTATTSSTG